MAKLYDEDGIDGPFERAMARADRKPRPRCACGRARRKAAAKCQRCLDADRAAAKASEPAQRWAKDWRAIDHQVAFIDGRVYVTPLVLTAIGPELSGPDIHYLEIDNGRWSRFVELADWKLADRAGARDEKLRWLLRAIARSCYCTSFPETGCDFCNGYRLPDGATPP